MNKAGRDQAEARGSGRDRVFGQGALKWVIDNPVGAFVIATLGSLVLAALLWQGSLFWPVAGADMDRKDLFSNASALVQAIVGTALVGASAFVAILIATSAAKTAESALSESRLNNKLNDPDFLAAKHALRGYQQYAFLMGCLLATYRLHRQTKQLRDYAAAGESKGGPVEDQRATLPVWNETLRQLQALLFDTYFVSTAYEAARFHDSKDPSADQDSGETRAQALRKNMAGLASTIEQILDPSQAAEAGKALMHLMARAQLLNRDLKRGCDALKEAKKPTRTARPEASAYPALYWFSEWVEQVPEFETDRDFDSALYRPFEELLGFGELGSVPGMIRSVLSEKFNPPAKECDVGRHVAALVATVIGDQATVLGVERCAAQTAKALGLEPAFVMLTAQNVGAALSDSCGLKQGNRKFQIFTCTREALPYLFKEGVLGPYTQGCVIIDGIRADDALGGIEKSLEEIGASSGGLKCASYPPDIYALIQRLAIHASGQGARADSRLASLQPEDEESALGDGPRLAWIGIDYRDLGHAPPTRLDDWNCELWAIFQRGGRMLGVDAAEMLGIASRAFSDVSIDIDRSAKSASVSEIMSG